MKKQYVRLSFLIALTTIVVGCSIPAPPPIEPSVTGIIEELVELTPTPSQTNAPSRTPAPTPSQTITPSNTPTPSPTPSPTADLSSNLLVEISGALQYNRKGWKEDLPLSFGTWLQEDDLVIAARNSQGLVVCKDLMPVTVDPGQNGPLPCSRSIETILFRNGLPVVAPRRLGEPLIVSIPYILTPRYTFIQDPHPLLSWNPSEKGKTSYSVVLKLETIVWQVETTSTELRYPENAPPLVPGIPYYLRVKDSQGNSSEEEQTDIDRSFILLEPDKIEQVNFLINKVHELNLNTKATLLLEADVFASQGLRADAIDRLRKLIPLDSSPAVNLRLADLYRIIGLFTESQKFYENAALGYHRIGDLYGEAHALLGSGLSHMGDQKDAEARTKFEESLVLFQSLGDQENTKWLNRILEDIQN